MRQNLCLAAVDGHKTMPQYDCLSPVVRSRVQNATINICCYCLRDIMHEARADTRNDYHWFICIEAFEKGNINDLRERIYGAGRETSRYRVPEFYGEPYNPSLDFYDPRRNPPRGPSDSSSREFQDWVDRRRWRDGPDDLREGVQRTAAFLALKVTLENK